MNPQNNILFQNKETLSIRYTENACPNLYEKIHRKSFQKRIYNRETIAALN